MRLILLLLLVVVGDVYVYSQQVFQGTVLDNATGNAVADASVSILNGNQGIIAYTYTNKHGSFTIQHKETMRFISINFIGYERQIIPVEEFINNKEYRLKPTEFKIKEVKITSNRIQERNDTLIYAISGFRMPQDRSIADILAKMPGLEVLPSGQIKFEDKAINKLYIEGMDLMGDRYALATNNLSGKVVKEVQVLRNHQPIATLRGKQFTEVAALNLVLSDAARFTFSGSADLGGGYSDNDGILWDARLITLFLGRQQQNLSLYKTNNIGQDVSDELRMQIYDADMQTKTDNAVLSIPKISMGGMIDKKRYSMNRSHLFATNHLYKMNKDATLRSQFNYLSKRNDMQEEEQSSYFYPDGTVTIAEDKSIGLKTDNYTIDEDYQLNAEKRFIRNRLVGSLEKDDAHSSLLTNGDLIHPVSLIKKREIANHFMLINTYASNRIFKLLSKNSYSDLPQKLTVTPGLYEELINEGNHYDGFVQNVRLRSIRSYTSAEFQFKVAGFYLNMETGFEYTHQSFLSSLYYKENDNLFQTGNSDFHNDLTFIDAKAFATPSFRYKDHKWHIRFNAPFSYHHYQLDYAKMGGKESNNPHFFVEPSLYMSYELNSFWNISNSTNYQYRVPDINKFYTDYIFTTYRNAYSGSQFYYYKSLMNALTLKFNNPMKGLFWSVSGMIAPNWQDKMLSSKQDGVLKSVEMVDIKHRNLQWSVRTRFSKSFGLWKLFTGFTGNYSEMRDKSLLSGTIIPYTSKNLSLSLNFSMQPCKYLSVEGSERYIYSALSSSITDGVSSEYYRSNLTMNIFPTEKWKLKWNNLWLNGNKPVNSSIYFMDISTSYLFNRVEIELTMNNVLNKRNFQQTIYSSMNEISTLNYFRSREILVKLMVSL